MLIPRAQFAAIARAAIIVATGGPAFSQLPYLAPEVFEGDVVDYSPGISTGSLSSVSVLLNAVNEGSSYTTIVGDAGKTLLASQSATDGTGTNTVSSSPVTVATLPKFKDLGFLGANVGAVSATNRAFLFLNAALDTRCWDVIGNYGNTIANNYTATLTFSAQSGTGITATASGPTASSAFPSSAACVGQTLYLDQGKTAVITGWTSTSQVTVTIPVALSRNYVKSWYRTTITLDANGWPQQTSTPQPCQLTVSTGSSTAQNYGTLPPSTSLPDGVYHCSYQSVGQTTVVSAGTFSGSTGVTVTNIVNQPDGVTTTFDLTVPSTGYVVLLNFTNGIQFLDIPRDGSSTSVGKPKFAPEALAHYSQFSSLRFMDFLRTNNNLVEDWADRPWNAVTCASQSYPWETWIDFVNAVVAYPGSRTTKVMLNLPTFATTDYATNLTNLLNSHTITTGVRIRPELGNEIWNVQAFQQGGQMVNRGAAEVCAIANYDVTSSVSSVTSDGGSPSTITVTTINPLSTYLDPANGQPFIVNGATVWVYDGSYPNRASNGLTTVTVTGSNTFTYVAKGNVPIATAFTIGGSTPTQWVTYFKPTSNLLTDGLSYDLNQLLYKYQTRASYLLQQAWSAVRPQDQWLVGVQDYGFAAQAGTNSKPMVFDYGNWLSDVYYGTGDGSKLLKSWCYGVCKGNYVTAPSSTDVNATFTSLGTQTSPGVYTGLLNNANHSHRGHVGTCRQYGVHPIIYEGAPDLQLVPTINVALDTDARMGTLVTNILDAWFQNGGEEFHFYHVTPVYFTNAAQGGWQSLEYFGQSSPKINALLGYSTPRNYVNDNGAPGDLVLAYYQRDFAVPAISSYLNANNLMLYWNNNNAPVRNLEFTAAIPRTRRYAITPWGSDSVGSHTAVQVLVDGVVVGTCHLPANGPAAGSGGTVPSAVLDPVIVTLPAGGHCIGLQIAAGVGTSPGFLKVAMVKV